MTKSKFLRRKSKRIAVRLKSETEEHLFGTFDDGLPPGAPSGGPGGGELACLNDISTDLHHQAWLPDGYSRIFRSYVFGPSGFWTMAPLCCAAKFDHFLSLDFGGRLPC